MRLSVANYSFEVLPLEATLMVCHSLGFHTVDIAGFYQRGKCSFQPESVAADPQGQADILTPLLAKYGLGVSDFFPQFGAAPSLHSLNDPDSAVREENLRYVRGAAQFCKLIGAPGMTILPGVDHLSRALADNLIVSVDYLRQAVDIAGEYGVEVRFEPHMGSVADTPELALYLVEQVPGLRVTLDIAHFMLQYIPMERVYPLLPVTGHVHVRQARPGKLQVAHAEGVIDFPDVIARLKADGYGGAFTVEYVCADWFEVNRNDTLYESAVALEQLAPYF
ncbi:MAG: sugar phosphate isomerase/epimerase [Anaerolineae bacterium]|nr:sugar phosphate isomerase/epimerase [Anaerolineae bacterium]NUQ04559.1 sugar phosphate isomerase/epimerase [Anaerolineae bacterium]